MKPPYRRGASWLYEIAEERGQFSRAEVWFEPIDESARPEPNPFAEAPKEADAPRTDPLGLAGRVGWTDTEA
jgi:hypothetical protein